MPSATRYDDLARAITESYSQLPNRLQGIARFALGNPDAMALSTVAEIAHEAAVPPSAVIRFANALGYPGFTDLQRIYRERLVARSATYRERIKTLRESADDPGDLVRPIIDSAVGELERLREHLDGRTLKAAASLVVGAHSVHVIAQRRAFPIATYLVYALTQLELRAQLLDNTGGMLKTHAALIRRDELLIAASFRPYAPEVVDVAADCHKRGVPVIAFTDTPVSPLAAAAKVRFDVGDNFALPFRSLVGSMTAAQALVIAIGYALKPARKRARPRRP